MTSYSDWTKQVGDQWVDALKKAEDAIGTTTGAVSDATAKLDLPGVQVPEQITALTEAVTAKLPKPSEIIEANFELTSRLLAAHRELALKLLASYPGAAEQAPAAKATTRSTGTKAS